jgi:hypothetical protein
MRPQYPVKNSSGNADGMINEWPGLAMKGISGEFVCMVNQVGIAKYDC